MCVCVCVCVESVVCPGLGVHCLCTEPQVQEMMGHRVSQSVRHPAHLGSGHLSSSKLVFSGGKCEELGLPRP